MKNAAVLFILGFNYFVGVYFGVINIFYTLLFSLSLVVILRHIRRIRYAPVKDYLASPETPPVTIIIPVFNEEQVVVKSIRSALAAEYPSFEVLVVNDGSSDKTRMIKMIHLLVKLPAKKTVDDEYDAIAVALTHSAQSR